MEIKKEKKNSMLMTEGSIVKILLLFSVPLILGNLLQQTYNTVDSIIVGNYVGSNALAAVGSSTALINLLIGFSQGIAVGAGVIVSHSIGANDRKKIHLSVNALAAVGSSTALINLLIGFSQGIAVGAGVIVSHSIGANDRKKIHLSVHTAIMIAILLGTCLSIIGFIFTPQLLEWMKTPAEVMPESVTYLRLFSIGMVFNIVYNMEAGILNAVGNSKRSLLYLGIASVTNIILDLLFVKILGMGVKGVAIATNLSQMISCLLALGFLMKVNDNYKVYLNKIKLHKETAIKIIKMGLPTGIQSMVISLSNVLIQSNVNVYGPSIMAGFGAYLKIDAIKIIKMGLPTGIQSMVISLSNVLIQSNVNVYGPSIMAGFGAYLKIDGFNILPVLSLSMASTTFTGQNCGAGKKDRVKKGIWITLAIGIIYTIITGILLLMFKRPLMQLFTQDEGIILAGTEAMKYFCPFYSILAILHCLAGAVRGAGKTMPPMIILTQDEGIILAGTEAMKYFCPFYSILAILHCLAGAVRGAGKTMPPMIILLFSMCIFRIIWLQFILPLNNTIGNIYILYPVTWGIGLFLMIIYIWKAKWL